MLVIQQMKMTDLEAVLTLRHAWLSEEFGCAETSEQASPWISAYPDNDGAFGLEATDEDKPVGYLLVSWSSHPTMAGETAEIDEIYVAPGHRRQGVGRKLVEQMRRLLLTRVSDLTTIHAKADRNDVAGRAFWQALGCENWVWSLPTIWRNS